MKKFSWYTIIHPDWHKGEPPLFRLVGPAILPDEHTCDIYFKPNRKGGHRHNHIYNVCNRILFRSKSRRKIGIENKREYRETFELQVFGGMNPFCRVQFLDILKKGKYARIMKKRRGNGD